jgi:hypothetical protein
MKIKLTDHFRCLDVHDGKMRIEMDVKEIEFDNAKFI